MQALFPQMLQSVATAAQKIDDYMAECFNGNTSRLTEVQKDKYADEMGYLRNRLIQLDGYVNTAYTFDEGLTGDIDNYSKLLQQYRPQLEELVGFLLDRPVIFPDDPFAASQALFLEEILQDIIAHSTALSELLYWL